MAIEDIIIVGLRERALGSEEAGRWMHEHFFGPRLFQGHCQLGAWRWVVERSHSWTNRFRRILVRCAKKPENYLAFQHFACALISFRAAGLFR